MKNSVLTNNIHLSNKTIYYFAISSLIFTFKVIIFKNHKNRTYV